MRACTLALAFVLGISVLPLATASGLPQDANEGIRQARAVMDEMCTRMTSEAVPPGLPPAAQGPADTAMGVADHIVGALSSVDGLCIDPYSIGQDCWNLPLVRAALEFAPRL